MADLQTEAARRFITSLFGEPFDDHWWMSENDRKSRIGKDITGWYITTETDEPLILTLSWTDLTPDDIMVKLYAVIGWALMHGIMLATPFYFTTPPEKGRIGTIQHTDQRDAG